MEYAHYAPLSLSAEEKDVTYPWKYRKPDAPALPNPAVTADMVQLLTLQSEPKTFYDYWIQPVTLTAGTHPTKGHTSTGYYSKGRRFGGILYSSTFREGTDALWNLNYSTYYSAIANPASLLYTADYRGRVKNASAWAGSVCSSTALKACGYIYPYSSFAVKSAFQEKTDHSIDNLEVGDILWRNGHVAGIVDVTTGTDGHVSSVKIIEQACYVMLFEITAQNWPHYFSNIWTGIFRGEAYMQKTPEMPTAYPENLSIIFQRGNNTYVTDYEQMLFYIPSADTVYLTRDGSTTAYATVSFPAKVVNDITVYDLAALFDGVGDYYFHTSENPTDICIKVISTGTVTIDPESKTASLRGYSNCKPHGYCVVRISEKTDPSAYKFYDVPEGYVASPSTLFFRQVESDTFSLENIPEDCAGWKLEVYYDTGYGWARAFSENIMYE